ncbi:MAG TPA: hypothetical protein PLS04_15695, partial [Mycobacterium sp.]|nr:hypothetical protein [Mycobacterium sp.]
LEETAMSKFQEVGARLKQSPRTWVVTGVAGFIGSNILETLLLLNQKVVSQSTVDQAADAVGGPLPATVSDSGRSPLPFAVAFAVTVLLALLIRRLRRHDDE